MLSFDEQAPPNSASAAMRPSWRSNEDDGRASRRRLPLNLLFLKKAENALEMQPPGHRSSQQQILSDIVQQQKGEGSILSEASTSTSTIELEDTTKAAFPAMLDYMYSPQGKVDVDDSNAVALRHLARYFRMHSLFDIVTQYIRDKADYRHAHSAIFFLLEADKYHDEKLVQICIRICAEGIGKPCLLEQMAIGTLPLHLFRQIMLSEALDRILSSTVTADFFRRDDLDRGDKELLKLFDELTAEDMIPVIESRDAAFVLLEWDSVCQSADPSRSSSLRSRCIDATSNDWSEAIAVPLVSAASSGEEGGEKTQLRHRNLEAPVQIELFEASLCRAMETVNENREEIERLRTSEAELEKEIEKLRDEKKKLTEEKKLTNIGRMVVNRRLAAKEHEIDLKDEEITQLKKRARHC